MNLTARQKRILTWVGYPLLVITTFVITLHLTFPYGRVKAKLVEELSEKYDVSIGSVEPTTFPGGIVIKRLMLRQRPTKPDEDPPLIQIARVELKASLLGLLRGRADIDIEATIGKGEVSGNLLISNGGLWAKFSTKRLPLQDVPGLAETMGLPMEGGLNATLDIHLPKQRWREAKGKITLSCPMCTAGDGVAKIKPRARDPKRRTSQRAKARLAFMGDGVVVPRLDLGDFKGVIEIKAGKGVITDFRGLSPDGEIIVEGDLSFKDPFKKTLFPGCLRFKFSEEFKAREPKFANIGVLMGAAIQPDGFANMRITGALDRLRFRAKLKCKSSDPDPRKGPKSDGPRRAPSIKISDEPSAKPPIKLGKPRQLDGPASSGPKISAEARAADRKAKEIEKKRKAADKKGKLKPVHGKPDDVSPGRPAGDDDDDVGDDDDDDDDRGRRGDDDDDNDRGRSRGDDDDDDDPRGSDERTHRADDYDNN